MWMIYSNPDPHGVTTGTVLREKLEVKNPKLLYNSKFLCHVITSFDKVGNYLRGDRFETIICTFPMKIEGNISIHM
jgi:hypothetical protein